MAFVRRGPHKALFRTDPWLMSTVTHDDTSVHGQCSTETVIRDYHHQELCLPIHASLVSFFLSLLTLTFTLKSSQSYLVLISSHFLFPFSRMREATDHLLNPWLLTSLFSTPVLSSVGKLKSPSVLPTGFFLVVKIEEQF